MFAWSRTTPAAEACETASIDAAAQSAAAGTFFMMSPNKGPRHVGEAGRTLGCASCLPQLSSRARGVEDTCGGGWRPNDNPKRDPLWLLPSGPDQVGEALVRRRSPRRHMADGARGGKGK